MPSPRVLILMSEDIGLRVAGPAIRAIAMARVLGAGGWDVVIATLGEVSEVPGEARVTELRAPDAEGLVDSADMVVVQGPIYTLMPWLRDKDVPQVMDLYNPFHIELIGRSVAQGVPVPAAALAAVNADITAQLARADLVLCSNTRQRDLWLGQLAALGRLSPTTAPGELDALVRIAPFGIDAATPVVGNAIRGTVAGIGDGDFVLLWAGGIYDWFDPITLIEAIDIARKNNPRVKLFFLSAARSSANDATTLLAATRRRAADLGLTGTHVFFNETWVEFDRRAEYLADADAGVTTHRPGLETWFSHRTRNLDYLWAGLPIITSEGDLFADLVVQKELGIVVPSTDPEKLAAAIAALAADPARVVRYAANARAVAETLSWEHTLEPLVAFAGRASRSPVPPALPWSTPTSPGRANPFGALSRALAAGGPREVARRIAARRRRRALGRPGRT